MVDTHTHFSAAIFIPSKSTKDIWNNFLACWVTAYVGYPDKLRIDQESAFTGKGFTELVQKEGIEIQLSGVQSHNAIGIGERYHAPLRRIFDKINLDAPRIDPHLALQIAVKAMNDTMGPEGLVPSMLVFGVLPRMPPRQADLPGHEERMRALRAARAEMCELVAQMKVRIALRSRVPPAASYLITAGDSVYVHNEKTKRWDGPFTVSRTHGKYIWIQRHDGEKQYSIDHCLPVNRAQEMSIVQHIHYSLARFATRPADDTPRVYPTEVLTPGDPRADSPEFQEAIQKEISGLIEKGVYEIVLKEDIDPKANILGGRFVLTVKNKDTDKELYKARFVAQGHRDKEKHMLVHASTNLRQRSIRMIACIAALFGFRIWTQDVTQAYLQSATMRDVYIRPTKEFKLDEGQLLKLLMPLYGLSDSGDYWDFTITDFLKSDMDMKQATLDLSLFFKKLHGKLQGLSGMYVDDGTHAGNKEFEKDNERIEKRFHSKPREFDNFKFSGITVETTAEGIRLHQSEYAKSIRPLPLDASFSQFRGLRQQLMWLSHSRPDIICAVNRSTQVTTSSFSATSIREINKIVAFIRRFPDRGLLQQKLDISTTHMRVYADSSFANNDDSTT